VACYTRFLYPRFRLFAALFQCHEEHQYAIRGQILEPITCVEPSPRLPIRECDADDKLSIQEFWRQFNIKMAIVIRYTFYAFSIYAAIRKNATPVYNESRVYLGVAAF
jgi:hypothetical protein